MGLPGRRKGGAEGIFRNRVEVVAVSLVGILAPHGPHTPLFEDCPGAFHSWWFAWFYSPEGVGG